MRIISAAALSVTLLSASAAPPAIQEMPAPHAGMVISGSTRLRAGTYRLASPSLDRPAIHIRGNGLVIDLAGVTIEGGDRYGDPDRYTGVGVLIEGENVEVIGGAIRGFKVAVLARNSPRLRLADLDLSYNWKPRLLSGYEQEHQADWLSFHNNEKDEWLRYGAAIYLNRTDDAEITNVRAVQGMNGLMVTHSSRLNIWNNTFSYLSGVGIGLYRVTDSRIQHNRVDYCVRGYSHGFYFRGQDSTGILMYEQTSRNVVAYNSFTHGGDGVFLWAGQSTMDTGQGGSNDNVFYDNDVSHAVANGIEATFSRNIIARNRIDDSWHGIWGGYSFDTVISHNTFAGNDEAIAIEHGQNIVIENNTFSGGNVGIRLWANATQDPDWGYAKTRDTRSRDYQLRDNTFQNMPTAVRASRTLDVRLDGNRTVNVTEPYIWDAVTLPKPLPRITEAPPVLVRGPFPDAIDAKLPAGARRGRSTIIVDDWGPYDYLSPKLWPAGRLHDRPFRLRVLGPPGKWRLISARGARPGAKAGDVPGELLLTPADPAIDLHVELEYLGGEVRSPRGELVPPGWPMRFSYSLFDHAIDWDLRFWRLPESAGPVPSREAFDAVTKTPPARTENTPRLAFANARSFGAGFTSRIAVVATGEFTLLPGQYELVVTSDDGIRVWLDEKLVLEDWTIHGPKDDRINVGGGSHRLHLEYFQNTGSAALQVQIVK
jgi:parallel beta-helix repeat protein